MHAYVGSLVHVCVHTDRPCIRKPGYPTKLSNSVILKMPVQFFILIITKINIKII